MVFLKRIETVDVSIRSVTVSCRNAYTSCGSPSFVPHRLELFVGGCPICEEVLKAITVGKCAGCSLEVYDLTKRYEELAAKLKQYRIRCVPTLVIDGRIKLEGKPEFALICDEEMYRFLEERYSMD
jgi:glutaredoxin